MNSQQFIAKQQVKYYWKALKQATRLDAEKYRDDEKLPIDSFWEYEQTPRTF